MAIIGDSFRAGQPAITLGDTIKGDSFRAGQPALEVEAPPTAPPTTSGYVIFFGSGTTS